LEEQKAVNPFAMVVSPIVKEKISMLVSTLKEPVEGANPSPSLL